MKDLMGLIPQLKRNKALMSRTFVPWEQPMQSLAKSVIESICCIHM